MICQNQYPRQWCEYKIYLEPERFDDFLILLRTANLHFKEAGYSSKLFFVRYANVDDWHLRVRWEIKDLRWKSTLHEMVNNFLENLTEKFNGLKWYKASYRPNLEMYGGVEGTVYAENVFALDSEMILDFLDLCEQNSLEKSFDFSLCFSSIIMELAGWNFSFRSDILFRTTQKWAKLRNLDVDSLLPQLETIYKENSETILQVLSKELHSQSLEVDSLERLVLDYKNKLSYEFVKIKNLFIDREEFFTYYIFRLIHLHANRVDIMWSEEIAFLYLMAKGYSDLVSIVEKRVY